MGRRVCPDEPLAALFKGRVDARLSREDRRFAFEEFLDPVDKLGVFEGHRGPNHADDPSVDFHRRSAVVSELCGSGAHESFVRRSGEGEFDVLVGTYVITSPVWIVYARHDDVVGPDKGDDVDPCRFHERFRDADDAVAVAFFEVFGENFGFCELIAEDRCLLHILFDRSFQAGQR